ncbi:rust resistance kinase Lr10 [Eucalyptus grandis]|uniref:rust resistance kinase Lr10 n=1 Tax=Eucalyptus grandis TaxID=71139 RepID=UPI00192F078A|nr:rust resistance kinase Lr10 [Eucalyptus grandis]
MIKALDSMNVYPVLLLVLVLLQAMTSDAGLSNSRCVASSCGNIRNIIEPFRLKSDPRGCGDQEKELVCEDNRTVWYLYHGRFYVQSIDYSVGRINLVDDGLQKDNCSSLPQSLVFYKLMDIVYPSGRYYTDPSNSYYIFNRSTLAIVNCSKPVSSPLYISTGPCIKGSYSSNKLSNWNLYALVNPKASDVRDFCTISMWTWVSADFEPYEQINSSFYNYELIHNIMANGFVLEFYGGRTKRALFCFLDLFSFYSGRVCRSLSYDSGVKAYAITTAWDVTFLLGYFCVVKFAIGMPFVAIFLIYNYRRRHLANDKDIEEFLQAHNNFLPIRYSYSNIKKITRNFKHKLGEGGYGSVYKGMLRSGNEVAIKILKQSKAHGQDFISEVATIGRIHHVNVVQLIGFCFEGSKQALVYDLMSNGSLDKHIFIDKGDSFLDYRKIYEIALGVARGIEYLHRGCDMQILHFDIKPHNILLDKNFTPKVLILDLRDFILLIIA